MSHRLRPVHVVPDTLELYFAGVLPPAREAHVEEHLADCAWCAARARALFASLASWRTGDPDNGEPSPSGTG